MKRKFVVVGALVAIMGMATAPLAAADTLVTFTTSSTGTRVLTAALAPVFPAVNLSTQGQTISTASAGGTGATSLVTEVLANGSAWSVKAQMCAPDNYTTPVNGNCTTQANRMVRVQDGTGDDMIDGSIIAVSHAAPVVVAGGGTTSSGSEANLGGQITLLSNTGQSAGTVYSGTYASDTDLTISNFTRTGTWKGMWVVTTTL